MKQFVFYRQLQKDAEDISKKAAKILISMQSTAEVAVQKDELDLSTNADITSERYIIDSIRKKYPDHGIHSEEMGDSETNRDYVWIIDPLDGTKEYYRGSKEFNCIVAVSEKDKLVAGVLYAIGTQELYSCSRGNGAFLNNKKIRVSQTSDLNKSFIGFHIPGKSNSKQQIEQGVSLLRQLVYRSYRVRPGWYDANWMGFVARGVFEAHVIPIPVKIEDVAATLLLIDEAGGTVTDMEGYPIKNRDSSRGIVASNGKIHEKLLEIINKT